MFSQDVAEDVVSVYLKANASARNSSFFSAREYDLAGFLSDGLSNEEISAKMGYSIKSVEGFLTGFYMKLGVRNRAEAVAESARRGLVSFEI